MQERALPSQDTDEELKRDLESPVRSVRLFAFDQILRTGTARRIRDFLQKRESVEDDEECLMLLSHALAMANEDPQESTPSKTAGEPRSGQFPQEQKRTSRTPDEWKKLASNFPDSLAGEDDPMILAELITQLGKHLEPSHRPALERLVVHPFSMVRSAALAVLLERFPDQTGARLPNALKSNNPRIRALAIRGLARIDPGEAVRHMGLMLLGSDPGLRRYGLQIAALFPFPQIRDLLVQFVLIADEPVLLRAAAVIIRSNPDPELPFRLLEAKQQATGNRKKILHQMFDLAFKALETSGILGDRLPAYSKQLEEWILRQDTKNRLKELFALIPEETPDPAQALAELLGEKCQDQGIQKALQDSLAWNLSDHQENAIRSLLARDSTPAPAATSVPPPVPGITGTDLERHLAKLCISPQTAEAQSVVTKILTDETAAIDLRILALRAATNWDLKGFEELAERWLDHADPRVIAGALEYLTATDPERVYPKLGRFLAATNPLVKLRAILLLKRYDLPQAISSLLALIKQPDVRTHRLLATSLVQFEFSLLRHPLTEFLCQTNGCVFLKESLCLFQANPAPENLFCLFRIERSVPSFQAIQVLKARQASESLLVELGLLSPEEIVQTRKDWEAELTRLQAKAAQPSPYALEQVFPDQTGSATSHLVESLRQAMAQIDRQTIQKAAVVLLIFAPLFYGYWSYIWKTDTPFSLSPGFRPTWQRLARRSATPSPAVTSGTLPQPVVKLSTAEDFLQAQSREILRERSLPAPSGMGQDAAWMLQATGHPLIGAGLQSAEQGKVDEAIKLLEQALADAPDNPYLQVRVLSALCHLYQMRGDDQAFKKTQARFLAALDSLPGLFPVPFRDFLTSQEKFLDSLKSAMNAPHPATGGPALSPSDTAAGVRQISLFLAEGSGQPRTEDPR